ncbi:phosphatase, partial [Streptomyces abyssalis]
LDDLGQHLGQLRAGAPAQPDPQGGPPPGEGSVTAGAARPAAPAGRAGSAEWNLLTDEVSWSEELYGIFGRTPGEGPLSLDELPSWVLPEDQPLLAAAVTGCLVDGRPIDQEFRIMRPDGAVRSLHLLGEPVLDGHGGTAAMWAVLRDVSSLRRSELAVRESRETVRHERHAAQAERRLAAELQETVLPPLRGSRRIDGGGSGRTGGQGALDIASHYLPSPTSTMIGGDWYDALELPGGTTLLSAGDLTGHGVAAASAMAMLLGAVRGMAFAGVEPGALMGHLNDLLEASAQPALGSAVCGRYDPRDRTFTWSQAGHPAPVVFRGAAGRALRPPQGVLLGATPGAAYGQRTEVLRPGDLLVLHTDELAPRVGPSGTAAAQGTAPERLLALAERFAGARSAQECVQTLVDEFGGREREGDACVLVARVTG